MDVCAGDGASLCTGAAAGERPQRQRGRRGGPDSQTNPERSQKLEGCECTTCFVSVCVWLWTIIVHTHAIVQHKLICDKLSHWFLSSLSCSVRACISCIPLCVSWPMCCQWMALSNSAWTLLLENWPRLLTKNCRYAGRWTMNGITETAVSWCICIFSIFF